MFSILCCAAIVLTAVIICVSRARLAAFEERYPPISDAEFLARCRPGVNPEVALKVRRMVAEYFGIDYERVHPSTRFVEDLAD